MLLKILLFHFFFPQQVTTDLSIELLKKDAVVWSVHQNVTGRVFGAADDTLWLFLNGIAQPVEVVNGKFEIPLVLRDSVNLIVVSDSKAGQGTLSDTLKLSLGYQPVPIIMPEVRTDQGKINLDASIIENPLDESVEYQWKAAPTNPEPSQIFHQSGSRANLAFPHLDGDYGFELTVKSHYGERVYKTLIRKEGQDFIVYGSENKDHPWMEKAILYQLSPYNFANEGGLNAITDKLPEIAELGINTLYLQPIFESSRKGQGYDVVNYFGLNPKYGNSEDLKNLISKSKELGMKVLFDLVLNHSSLAHPYAKDRIAHGDLSHYNDFYHTVFDGAKYSSHYNADEHGFINYFWKDLVNLNFDNEEVQRWMLEACKYWVREFDIDGYRFDAIWGVMARKPEFGNRLRNELKSIKPDLFMLAEAKGGEAEVYDLGYDAAYDWTSDTLWVSQWSWEYEYNESESKTIFNHPDSEKRADYLKKAFSQTEDFQKKILRFTENNDLPRFPKNHGLDRSKMASTLVFAVAGIPMLYQGQEIGVLSHPYTSNPVYYQQYPISAHDSLGLFAFYKNLITKRKNNEALRQGTMEFISLPDNPGVLAFWRQHHEEKVIVILNPSNTIQHISIQDLTGIEATKNTKLFDYLNNDYIPFEEIENKKKITLNPYETYWLINEK